MATKRKDGLWQEAVTVDGKRKYFYGHTRAEVKEKIYRYNESKQRGKTFSEVADAWWEEAGPKIAVTTARGYKPAMNRAIEEFNCFCAEIRPQDCYSFLSRFAYTHAQKTVNTQYLVLNLIFTFAVSRGMAESNPVRDIEIPRARLETKKRVCPPQSELEKIKTSTDCTFGMFPFWAIYTGLRRGELLALRWENVDLENREIKVKQSVYFESSARPKLKEPKTETSMGTVPILDALYAKIAPIAKKHGYVFPGRDGDLMTQSEFEVSWRHYQKEAGVTFTAHQLRHAYATILFEAGIAPEEMQVLLRHAQLSTTMDIYREIRQDHQKKIHAKYLHVDF